ncbi:MAG: MBL fold metallo-hydrolase RNA specificity domain-containing protein, partial [Verrucomicrobiales bacterium]
HEEVKIFGEEYEVKAEIDGLDSFSGHADHSELLDYFNATGGRKEKVWLVHGERSRSEKLQEALRGLNHGGSIDVAELAKVVEF